MFPGEMVILMAIAAARASDKKLLSRSMDVTGEYITYLYNSLVRRGYLKENISRGYQLTLKGREALFEFLRKNETRTNDTIETLQQLGIDIGQGIDKREREAGKVEN